MQIEVKAASAGDVGGVSVQTTKDPFVFEIIASVTGVVDSVKDRILPGAYKETLKRRRPKIIKDHEWSQRLGKALEIEEYLPGDGRLPKVTSAGSPWPPHAGALVAKVRLFQSREGRDAAERWREYGPDQQFSIGYVASPLSTKSREGVRDIPEIDLYEISDVLWAANDLCGPMPPALAMKMLTGINVEAKAAPVLDIEADAETVEQPDTEALDIESLFDDDVEFKAAMADLDVVAEGVGELADGTLLLVPETKALLTEVKFDTSSLSKKPGKADNWVEQAGGLPAYIRAIANSLVREKGFTTSRAIATAVATVKRWAKGGGKVSPATKTKAQKALAEWDAKRARSKGTKTLDLFGWSPEMDPTAMKGAVAALEGKGMARLAGTIEERQDLLREALRDLLLPLGEAEDGHVPVSKGYLMIEGTYPDRVIVNVERYDVDARGDVYEVPYHWDGDEVMLGTPRPVRLVVSAVGGDEDADPVEALVEAMLRDVDDLAMAGKGLGLPVEGALETKAGRVLSGSNLMALQEAVQRLMAVLKAAGVDLTVPVSGEPPAAPMAPMEGKAISLGDLPDPVALVASLRAAASGTTAA